MQKPPPPATEAELSKAEESLGFALPPLLRRLYAEIGDGGFGPGLLPLFTPPHLRGRAAEGYGVVDLYHHYREEALEASLEDDDENAFPGRIKKWKARRLPMADVGCAMLACVDCDRRELPVWSFDAPEFRRDAPSLAAWLERWLSPPPQPIPKPQPAPPPRPPAEFCATLPPATPPGPNAATAWFIKERAAAFRRAQPQLPPAETEETLTRETMAMFGLGRDAVLGLVQKALAERDRRV